MLGVLAMIRPAGHRLVSEGRLLRREPGGALVTHADLGQPGWNDIVADGRGNIYVNRAGFNPMSDEDVKPGFVFLVRPDGSVRQVADDILFPNGIAVTASNETLIVADSYRHQLGGFDIGDDGSLPGQRCVRVAEGGKVLDSIALDRGGFACVLGAPTRTTLFIVTATWQGMTGPEPVTPRSGQVLAVDVDVNVPGAGCP